MSKLEQDRSTVELEFIAHYLENNTTLINTLNIGKVRHDVKKVLMFFAINLKLIELNGENYLFQEGKYI